MNRLSWVVLFAFAGVAAYLAGDLLYPDPVPVANAVRLTGTTVPTAEAPREGYFIVPPRVVDFRNFDLDDLDDDFGDGVDDDDDRDDDDRDDDEVGGAVNPSGSGQGTPDDSGDTPDDSDGRIRTDGSDDSPDDPDDTPDDPDDSVDDDD